MVQLNLLPDIKLQQVKAQKIFRSVLSLFLAASIILGVILVLLVIRVFALQRPRSTDLNKDIVNKTAELATYQDLDKMVTIQNQIDALPKLYDSRPAVYRFAGFMNNVIASTAKVESIELQVDNKEVRDLSDFKKPSFTSNQSSYDTTVVITGSTTSLRELNRITDTLKFAEINYLESGQNNVKARLFKDVVVDESINNNAKDKQEVIGFEIQMKMLNASIVESNTSPKVTIPDIVSTQSEVERPCLFDEATCKTEGTNEQ